MKRCPECSREYDNSMMFCLDDGAELLYGPASMDEPATAILSESRLGTPESGQFSVSATRPQIHSTAAEAEPHRNLSISPEKLSFSAKRAAKPLAGFAIVLLLLICGFFGYQYFAPT